MCTPHEVTALQRLSTDSSEAASQLVEREGTKHIVCAQASCEYACMCAHMHAHAGERTKALLLPKGQNGGKAGLLRIDLGALSTGLGRAADITCPVGLWQHVISYHMDTQGKIILT